MRDLLVAFILMLVCIFSLIGMVTLESRVFQVVLFVGVLAGLFFLVRTARRLWADIDNMGARRRPPVEIEEDLE